MNGTHLGIGERVEWSCIQLYTDSSNIAITGGGDKYPEGCYCIGDAAGPDDREADALQLFHYDQLLGGRDRAVAHVEDVDAGHDPNRQRHCKACEAGATFDLVEWDDATIGGDELTPPMRGPKPRNRDHQHPPAR